MTRVNGLTRDALQVLFNTANTFKPKNYDEVRGIARANKAIRRHYQVKPMKDQDGDWAGDKFLSKLSGEEVVFIDLEEAPFNLLKRALKEVIEGGTVFTGGVAEAVAEAIKAIEEAKEFPEAATAAKS